MTAPVRNAAASPVRRPAGRRPSRASAAVLATSIVALAAVLRLVRLGPSYDLSQDELDYVVFSTSMLRGNFPPVFPGQGPFLLHPPLLFALGAGWQKLLGPAGFFTTVDEMRVLNAILAVVTCGCLYVLGSQLFNRWAGVAAALLFALDPYILRQNGRVFLETATLAFVLLGYVILIRVVQDRARWPLAAAAVGGFVAGTGVVAKEMGALLVVPPLLILWAAGWGVRRRVSGTALVASVVPYAIYLVAVAAVGAIPEYWQQVSSGFSRFFGVHTTTGFNRTGSPSLTHTLLTNLSMFAPTYFLVAASLVATVYLLVVTRRTDHRLAAIISGWGAVTVFYSLFFGTIEEQFLYFLMGPAILSLVVGTAVFLARRPTLAGGRRWTKIAAAVLAVVCLFDLGNWARIRAQSNNGQQRIAAWFERHDHGAVVNNDTIVTQQALTIVGIPSVAVTTPAAARADHVRYLTVLPYEVNNNYANLTPAEERKFTRTGHVVWSYNETTYGHIKIYETDNPSVW